MVRDLYCVPGAGVSVEQMFSVARHQGRFNRSYTKDAFRSVMIGRSRLAAEAKMRDAIVNGPGIEELNKGDNELSGQAALADYHERVEALHNMWKLDLISDDEGTTGSTGRKRHSKGGPGSLQGGPKRRAGGSRGHLQIIL